MILYFLVKAHLTIRYAPYFQLSSWCGNVVKQGFSCLTHYTQYGAEARIDDGDAKDNAY